MTAVLLDASLYAVITIILAPSFRELRLINLSAGIWVVVGGWCIEFLFNLFGGNPQQVNSWVFLVILPIGLIQVFSPLFLSKQFRSDPLCYMLVAFGVALSVSAIGGVWLLDYSGSTISISRTWLSGFFYVAAAMVATFTILAITSHSKWAELVFDFRSGKDVGWRLTKLFAIEIALLLLIGAAAGFLHKGIFNLGEYLTIVPILALMATRANKWKGPLVAFAVVLASHVADATLPQVLGPALPITICLLVIVVFLRDKPAKSSLAIRVNHWLPSRLEKEQAVMNCHSIGSFTFLTFGIIGTVTMNALNGSEQAIYDFAFYAGMAVIAWISMRYLGIMSISWPVIGAVGVYIWAHLHDTTIALTISLAGFLVVSCIYLAALRTLPQSTALLVDLSVVIAVHRFIQSNLYVSGAENVLLVELGVLNDGPQKLSVAMLSMFGITLAMFVIAYTLDYIKRLRPYVVALANPPFGQRNGYPVNQMYIGGTAVCIVVAVLMSLCFHGHTGGITPDSLTVVVGLTVLLLAFFIREKGAAFASVAIFLVFVVLNSAVVGAGAIFGGLIGIAFVVLGFSLAFGSSAQHE